MCGRYTLTASPDDLEQQFHAKFARVKFAPRFNVAPSQNMPMISNAEPSKIQLVRWGLEPSWWKLKSRSLINIRAESLTTKPLFRRLFEERRCLVLADGFYEWSAGGRVRQPHYFKLKDSQPFAFAGVWEMDREGPSFSIITTEPNSLVGKIHDRMPCILKPEDEAQWLSTKTDRVELDRLLYAFPAKAMESYAVSRAVNSPTVDTEELIVKI